MRGVLTQRAMSMPGWTTSDAGLKPCARADEGRHHYNSGGRVALSFRPQRDHRIDTYSAPRRQPNDDAEKQRAIGFGGRTGRRKDAIVRSGAPESMTIRSKTGATPGQL